MFNSIKWSLIRDVGLPDRAANYDEVCLVIKRGVVMTSIFCPVACVWLNTDCRPFYTQHHISHWVYIKLPNKNEYQE